MTGIVIRRAIDGFVVAADGVTSTVDGLVGQATSKIASLPHMSGFVTARGYGSTVSAFIFHSWYRAGTFDELVECAADVAREIKAEADSFPHDGTGVTDFTLYFGGWSEGREQFEAYAISTAERTAVCGTMRAPFAMQTIDGVHAPGPSGDFLKIFGLADREITFANAPLWLHAARLTQIANSGGPERGAVIGGFLERYLIGRNTCRSEIVFRYQDAAGQPLAHHEGETAALLAALAEPEVA